jgi:hypothetical protein
MSPAAVLAASTSSSADAGNGGTLINRVCVRQAAAEKKTITHMPNKARAALRQQGAAVARRKNPITLMSDLE